MKRFGCLLKHFYEKLTPYIQITGLVAVIVPASFFTFYLIQEATAFESRITSLESFKNDTNTNLALINQKVDLMIDFWHIPRKE